MSLTPEQIEKRKGLITATDAAAICGVSPWATAHDVYAQKLGLVPPLKQTFAMRRGHALEALGIEWLAEARAPMIVSPAGDVTRVHRILDWLGATPDALVFPAADEQACAVGEVKTAGVRAAAAWDDEDGEPCVPDHYLVQVQVQLTVVGVKKAYVAAMLATEDEPRLYEIEHDPDLEVAVLEACDDFRRNHLEPRIPPPFDGTEAAARLVKALFPRPTRDMLASTPETETLAAAYFAAKEREKCARDEAEQAAALLCAHIGEHEGISGAGWRALWTHRDEVEVKAFTRKAHRAFDLRRVGKGKRAA